MARFSEIKITDRGFEGVERIPGLGRPTTVTVVMDGQTSKVTIPGDDTLSRRFSASFPLFLIREAWGAVDFEDLADGYGPGAGTHGDWSGIRDSSEEAVARMFERALNHFFPSTGR